MDQPFQRPGTPGHLVLIQAIKAFIEEPNQEAWTTLCPQLIARREDHVPDDDHKPLLRLLMEAISVTGLDWVTLPASLQEFLLSQWSRSDLELALGQTDWCLVAIPCSCNDSCSGGLLICKTSVFPDFVAPEHRGPYIAHQRDLVRTRLVEDLFRVMSLMTA